VIVGSVFFEGTPPEPKVWRTASSDPACQRNGNDVITSEEIVVNTNGTLRNVFVYISSSFGSLQFPIPSEPVILDQRGCRYAPHVLGMRVGQTLLILNGDSTMHNVHASPQRNRAFNAGMTAVVKKLARTFDRPEVMVPFNCNVHPWMSAYAGVLNHPFFAVTETEGSFRVGPLPPGEYEVTAWHEHFGVLKQITQVGVSEERQVDFNFWAR
jgi:plastocyanin